MMRIASLAVARDTLRTRAAWRVSLRHVQYARRTPQVGHVLGRDQIVQRNDERQGT